MTGWAGIPMRLRSYSSAFNQPRLRTMVSPSPSILKHEEPVQLQDKKRNGTRGHEGAGPADGSSLHAIFLRSRLVEPAERGNTELRNAVQSAANSGFQSDFLRVSMPTDTLNDHTKATMAEELED
jgi:trehalose 6-phosphate synthase/phosphatase